MPRPDALRVSAPVREMKSAGTIDPDAMIAGGGPVILRGHADEWPLVLLDDGKARQLRACLLRRLDR